MEELLEVAKKVSVKLTEREETVSVIESSSGGLISSSLLAQPGASAYYIGGQIVYTAKSIRGVTGLRLRDLKEKNIRSSSEPFALLLGEKVYVMAPRPGRIHKEYKLPFASMGLKEDLRDIKNNKEFVSKREEILSMIWDMEEEIMGKEV